jgi:hypothetical protein
VEAGWEEGRRHTVDCDLKAFFDTVNHERLMTQLRKDPGPTSPGPDPPLPAGRSGIARRHARGDPSRSATGRSALTAAGQHRTRSTR